MEITGEDGTLIRLPFSSVKLIGRGSGFSTTDTTIAKHQISLKATAGFTENDDAPPPDKWWEAPPSRNGLGKGAKLNRVRVEVLGPNPVCVLRQGGNRDQVSGKEPGKCEVEFLGQGEGCWLVPGDKVSLSIVKPVFYTVGGSERRELAGKALGGELKACVEVQRGGQKIGALEQRKLEREKGKKKVGIPTDEEESKSANQHGRTDEHESDKKSPREEQSVGKAEGPGHKRGRDAENESGEKSGKRRRETEQGGGSEQPIRGEETAGQPAGVNSSRNAQRAAGPSDEGFDPIKEYGLIVEGAEFDQYDQKRAQNTRPWSWQIGPSKQQDDSDDEPPEEEEEPPLRRPSAPGGSQARAKPAPQKRGNSNKGEDDEDEWTGDSESEAEEVTDVEKGLRGLGKSPAVTTRSHDGSRSRRGSGSEPGGSVAGSRGKEVSMNGTERKAAEQRKSGTERTATEIQTKGTDRKPTEERKRGTERNLPGKAQSGTIRTATEHRKSGTERKSGGAKAKGGSKKKGRGGNEDESDEDESTDDEPTEEDLDFIVDDDEALEEDASDESDDEEEWEDDDDKGKAPKQPRGKQAAAKDTRPMCRYGSKCYRKNPDHLKQFRHPSR